jgi:Raf kinase inhibitor-like YbhB/YbcL family protein
MKKFRRNTLAGVAFLGCGLLGACNREDLHPSPVVPGATDLGGTQAGFTIEKAPNTLILESPAFQDKSALPPRYSCDGEGVAPPLQWHNTPRTALSQAIVMRDLDAPQGAFTHWLVWNLPPAASVLREDTPAQKNLSNDAQQGTNDFGKIGYGGVCPPSGRKNRYVFSVYALDARLNMPAGATFAQLEKAMQGHVLARGEMSCEYSRSVK